MGVKNVTDERTDGQGVSRSRMQKFNLWYQVWGVTDLNFNLNPLFMFHVGLQLGDIYIETEKVH